jgi:hypothetical protein
MSAVYRIPDEPVPGRWSTFAVNPMWPLLSLMLGGSWISILWFVFNAFAIGSHDRRRQVGLAALALVGTVVITFGIFYLAHVKILTGDTHFRFARLALMLWKLTFAYVLMNAQMRSFSLYEYYGGLVRNGLYPLIGAFVLATQLLKSVPPFWYFVMVF